MQAVRPVPQGIRVSTAAGVKRNGVEKGCGGAERHPLDSCQAVAGGLNLSDRRTTDATAQDSLPRSPRDSARPSAVARRVARGMLWRRLALQEIVLFCTAMA